MVHFTVVCLVAKPLNRSEAKVDLVMIQTLLLFKCTLLSYLASKILVSITTISPLASLQIKDLATKYTTVKRPIDENPRQLTKKARKTNDKLLWNAFRYFRQEVKREIRISEMEYVPSELLKCNGNTNSIWKVINHCIPNRDPPLTTVEDPVVQANRFNDFYVLEEVAAAAKAEALCDHNGFSVESVELVVPATDDLQNTNKFEFHAVTEQDIEKIVEHIPSNKAPGLHRGSVKVLKDSPPATLPVITNLINTSNCFAQVWKSAVVIPNLKPGDPDDPENTRPIFLLPILSKICERAAHAQFMDFLEKNCKTSSLKSENRKFHSTETTLLHYTDQLLKSMDGKNRMSAVVLLDMSKGFDSIHETCYRSCTYWLCLTPSSLD